MLSSAEMNNVPVNYTPPQIIAKPETHARADYFYNRETRSWIRYCLRLGVACVSHPFDYAKTLIQLGYEPIAPIAIVTIGGSQALRLPGAFSYIALIARTDGTVGLFRGLSPKIIGSLFGMFFTERLVDSLSGGVVMPTPPKKPLGDENFTNELEEYFIAHIKRDFFITAAGSLLTYPFQLITVRMMAQFVGHETLYNSVWSSIKEIYGTDGVLGFYNGFVPFVICEVGAVVLTGYTVFLIRKFGAKRKSEIAQQCNASFVQFFFNCLLYPFQVVSTCISTNRTRLQAGNLPIMPVYHGWPHCLKDLYNRSELMRGSYLFWRSVPRSIQMMPLPVQLPYNHNE